MWRDFLRGGITPDRCTLHSTVILLHLLSSYLICQTPQSNFFRLSIVPTPLLPKTSNFAISSKSKSVTTSTSLRDKMTSKPQSRSSSCSRRPKLMRASATAPSLATSNASRKDLASLQSSSRATTILTRVASYSAPKDHPVRCSPGSSLLRSSSISRSPESAAVDTRKEVNGMQHCQQIYPPLYESALMECSGCLFQLPKFRGLPRLSGGRGKERWQAGKGSVVVLLGVQIPFRWSRFLLGFAGSAWRLFQLSRDTLVFTSSFANYC